LGFIKSNPISNTNENITKGKNATPAFANITKIDDKRKDDQKSQETNGLKF
jgi:hypothetical protein